MSVMTSYFRFLCFYYGKSINHVKKTKQCLSHDDAIRSHSMVEVVLAVQLCK